MAKRVSLSIVAVVVLSVPVFFSGAPAHAGIVVSMESGTDGGPICTWPDDADGDVAPTTTITGATTEVEYPYGIDVYAGYIYAVNDDSPERITIHPVDADGDVPPTRMISGPATGLDTRYGIAVDATGIYV